MIDIRKRDRAVFIRELFRPGRVMLVMLTGILLMMNQSSIWPYAAFILALGVVIFRAHQASIPRRFRDRRFLSHWNACEERLRRFDSALKELRRRGIADLQDLPTNVHQIYESLYVALRRADQVSHEITASEGWLTNHPGASPAPSNDRQAQELYRMADRNVAEYRQQIQAVVGGVQRTEAQAIVFVTTLDTLRVKMLGYRLTGRSPEMASDDFMQSIVEAKMQLDAIDKALDELELTPFPKTVTLAPTTGLPPLPNHPLEKGESADEELRH